MIWKTLEKHDWDSLADGDELKELKEDLESVMEETELPFTFHHFTEDEMTTIEPPFAVYLIEGPATLYADDTDYFTATNIAIEVYSDRRDPELETRVEDVLRSHEFTFSKYYAWIESERLYEVRYEFSKI